MKKFILMASVFITLSMFLPQLVFCDDSLDKLAFDIIQRVHSKDGDLGWDILILGMKKNQLEKQLRTKLKLRPADSMWCGAYQTIINLKGHEVILEFPDNRPDSRLLSILVYWYIDKKSNEHRNINIETLRELDKKLRKNNPRLTRKEGREGRTKTIEEGSEVSLYGIPKSDSLVILLKDESVYLTNYRCIDAN